MSSESVSVPKYAIAIKDLFFAYGLQGPPVLSGINFALLQGELLAVLGANGSGKSTLALLIAGIIPRLILGHPEGSIILNGSHLGEVVGRNDVIPAGLVRQEPESQIVTTSVEKECAFGPANLGVSRKEIEARVQRALAIVCLSNLRDSHTQELSHGQKQRLAIAAALCMAPSIIVLDEPFANVDSESRQHIVDAIVTLKEENGVTFVIVTHDLSLLGPIVDKCLLLGPSGNQIKFGSPAEVFEDVGAVIKSKVEIPLELRLSWMLQIPISGMSLREVFGEAKAAGYSRSEIVKVLENLVRDATTEGSALGHQVLSCRNLGFSYPNGGFTLRNINLELYEGECLGVVGRNGSGKSTLLKILSGIIKPGQGDILFCEKSTKGWSVARFAQSIGVVLQDPEIQLIYAETVFEEVRFGIASAADSQISDCVTEALHIVNLYHKREIFPDKLSFGEKKRVLLAHVLARGPKIVLLDEPFFSLDRDGRRDLAALIGFLQSKSVAIVLVSHDIEGLWQIADRLLVLDHGEVFQQGETRKVVEENLMRSCGLEFPRLLAVLSEMKKEGGDHEW